MRSILLMVLIGILSSCTPGTSPRTVTTSRNISQTEYLAGYGPAGGTQHYHGSQGYWDGNSVSGSSQIRINRNEQKAYFYKSGQLVGVSPISTGKTGFITPRGTFKITQKSADHRSSIYGVFRDTASGEIINNDVDIRKLKTPPGAKFERAPMPHFMRFNGGIGMHAGHLPGYPASHGCVRMPAAMAKTFFEHVKVGTPVIVE